MATQGTDLVTAEGLQKTIDGMSSEPGARIELYSNPNATHSNWKVALSQSPSSFRHLEVTFVAVPYGLDGNGYTTVTIPSSKVNGSVAWVPNTQYNNGYTTAVIALSGTTLSVENQYFGTGIARVVGIV